MKKIAIATAVIIYGGTAHAQSSVSISGIVDLGVARISNTGKGNVTGMISGGNSTSRLVIRGNEDLGGGLAASFWIEGELQPDTGNPGGLSFVRRSTLSLKGDFGEIRLGRDKTRQYELMSDFDTYGQRSFGAIEYFGPSLGNVALSYQRVSNSVTYYTPQVLGALSASVQYAFGEQQSNIVPVTNAAGISTTAANAATSNTGNYAGIRADYNKGDLQIGAALNSYKDAVRTVGTSSYAANYSINNIGAQYDFGVVIPNLYYQTEKMTGRGPVPSYEIDTFAAGLSIPLGVHTVRMQYSHYDIKNSANDITKFAIGYIYNFSKRTMVYTDIGRLKNKGASAVTIGSFGNSVGSPTPPVPGGSSTAFSIGLRHNF